MSEYDARITPVIMKAVGAATAVEELSIDGRPAYWLTGARHEFAYVDRDGNVDVDHSRLAGDVLLYETGDLLVRVEGAESKQAAIDLVRVAPLAGSGPGTLSCPVSDHARNETGHV